VAVVELVMSESVEAHVKLVCEQLNEKNRRWVAGLLSEVVGYGGTKWVAEITGLDPKTIRQGRLDLQTGLADSPSERVRRAGGGRPRLKKRLAAGSGSPCAG
jgi:hypothetical protein